MDSSNQESKGAGKMEYLIDGHGQIGAPEAFAFICRQAEQAGHEEADLLPIWRARFESEEAREALNELSDYRIEFIC
jgi:hypothetical protein